MPRKTSQKKFTATEIKDQTKKIQKEIEKLKRQNKGEYFTAVTPEDIERKLKRVNSPMIVSQGWGNATPGGTFTYGLGLYNPDPAQAIWLFAHVWVGSGNIDPNVGTFLLNVDPRFPRLTQPPFFGLTMAPNTSASLSFSIKVPSTAEKTNYMGNTCLMQLNWHDVGKYLDRGVFVFAVI